MWYEKLFPEQRSAADFVLAGIRDGGGVGLFSAQGTGKTIVSMAVLEQLSLDDVLIVCPLTAVEVTWVPRLTTMTTHTLCRTLQEFREASGPRILLIHYQLLSAIIDKIKKVTWSLVLFDESQYLKQRSTGWSRAARKLRMAFRRIALSGTPVDKSPIDVWAQMRFIDHRVLGEDWGPFADEYCRRGGFEMRQWVFNKRKLPRFLKTIKPYVYRLSDEFLKLKPINLHLVPVQLLGQQARIYEEMANESIVELDDCVVKADLPITRKAKEEQIVNGFLIDDDGHTHVVGHAKERKLRRLLGKLSPPVVVCCKFLRDIEVVTSVASERYSRIEAVHGAKRKDRTRQIESFQGGQVDVMALQIRTGGVSIELTRSRNLIVYSMGHSFIDFDQLIKRLHRYGQGHKVNVYLLYVLNTVDDEKIKVVERKARQANFIVTHFERKAS